MSVACPRQTHTLLKLIFLFSVFIGSQNTDPPFTRLCVGPCGLLQPTATAAAAVAAVCTDDSSVASLAC